MQKLNNELILIFHLTNQILKILLSDYLKDTEPSGADEKNILKLFFSNVQNKKVKITIMR
jgi:hypothetical protein